MEIQQAQCRTRGVFGCSVVGGTQAWGGGAPECILTAMFLSARALLIKTNLKSVADVFYASVWCKCNSLSKRKTSNVFALQQPSTFYPQLEYETIGS